MPVTLIPYTPAGALQEKVELPEVDVEVRVIVEGLKAEHVRPGGVS